MQASRIARDRARRFRVDSETGELRELDHGQLVADWVELFAPVVFEPHGPTFWPPEGSLLLDHLPFRVRALDAKGKRIPAGRVAFDVFCAVGYQAGKPRLWRAQAFTSAHPANWSAFLGALPGDSKRIVCDAHGGMLRAIEARWPDTDLHQCKWHLRHALERLLAKEIQNSPSEELAELRERAEGALTGPSFWGAFVRAARAAEEREPRSLDRRQQPDHRKAVRPPRAVLRASGGHAAHHFRPGAAELARSPDGEPLLGTCGASDPPWGQRTLETTLHQSGGRSKCPRKRARSTVPMPRRVVAELRRLHRRSDYTGDTDLAFCHPDTGNPYDFSKMRKRFKDAVADAGIRPICFHDLRHTFGTRMAAAGAPLRFIQEWMGHKDYKTIEIYADFAPDPSREAGWAKAAFGEGADDAKGEVSDDRDPESPPETDE